MPCTAVECIDLAERHLPEEARHRQHDGIADPRIVTTLRGEVAERERQIESFEAHTAEARSAPLHLAAATRIFDPEAFEEGPGAGHLDVTEALPRSQLFERCEDAFRASPEPLCTRALARHVIVASSLDVEDRKLRLSVAHRVGAMMARFEERKQVVAVGERDRATLRRLP